MCNTRGFARIVKEFEPILSSGSYCSHARTPDVRNTPQKAIALGYEDVASFTRVFRKIIGLPPGEYREGFPPRASLPTDLARADNASSQLDT
jgi:hypothetical protein